MKLEVGKYYKTRDGRKVGPMFQWDSDWGHGAHGWQVGHDVDDECTTFYNEKGDIWRGDGTSDYTGYGGQLVEEWSDGNQQTQEPQSHAQQAAEHAILITVKNGDITITYDGREQ